MKPLLLIGYGNPGRGDDGLGPALVEHLETVGEGRIELISDYQLTVDLAYDIVPFQTVVFADASMTGDAPYSFQAISPAPPFSFTSHSQRPEGVLYVASELFGARPQAYLLAIRGYRFNEFNEELSTAARGNLQASIEFVRERFGACSVQARRKSTVKK